MIPGSRFIECVGFACLIQPEAMGDQKSQQLFMSANQIGGPDHERLVG